MGGGGGGVGEGNLEDFGCVPEIYLPDPTKALKYNLMTPPLSTLPTHLIGGQFSAVPG